MSRLFGFFYLSGSLPLDLGYSETFCLHNGQSDRANRNIAIHTPDACMERGEIQGFAFAQTVRLMAEVPGFPPELVMNFKALVLVHRSPRLCDVRRRSEIMYGPDVPGSMDGKCVLNGTISFRDRYRHA